MESNYKKKGWFIIPEITSGLGSVKHIAGWWSKGAIAYSLWYLRAEKLLVDTALDELGKLDGK